MRQLAGTHRQWRASRRGRHRSAHRAPWALLLVAAVAMGPAVVLRSAGGSAVDRAAVGAPPPAPDATVTPGAASVTFGPGAPTSSAVPPASPASRARPPVGTRRELTGIAIPGTRILYDHPAVAETALDRVASLGVGWLRVDAAWSEIEAVRGDYDFSRLDRVVGAARRRGLSVLLILGSTAAWARPDDAEWNHGPTDETARAGFIAFAEQAARRYRGQVDAYEIWNEPNLPGSWSPRPDPAAYLTLLRAAYRAIHDIDPAVVVVSGGTGGGRTGVDSLSWYEDLYEGGLRWVTDAIGVHPYPDAPVVASGELATAERIRAVMDANGDAAKPLWGTETGAPTGGRPAVSEGTQAALLTAIHDRWASIRNVGPLLYYTLTDFGGADREDHFGLLRADGSSKPGYAALQRWTAGPA
ncbi:MAG TPA: cellulase family glycosylhydrolase [Actinoplanes sp.]|nr:cellulase family glycosylhydrolase [Actinoplanes sp.]